MKMKWNHNQSIRLSRAAVYLCMGLWVAVCGTAPWLLPLALRLWAPALLFRRACFLMSLYALAVPAAIALWELHCLLQNIGAAKVFLPQNVKLLRGLSWCCFLAALLSGVSAFYWLPFLAVAGAAAFMGLILRVVKNVFAEAVFLKEENDYTI